MEPEKMAWTDVLKQVDLWQKHYESWATSQNPAIPDGTRAKSRQKADRLDKILDLLANIGN